ncbi:MAG: alpha/beta fold hydrolase [Ilumatobacter sp.]
MRRIVPGAVAAIVVLAACAPPPPVAVEESRRSSGELQPDIDAVIPGSGEREVPTQPDVSDLPVVEAPETALQWGPCDGFGIPSSQRTGSSSWECAVLEVPMDPFGDDPAASDLSVELALTRHPATGDRRGAVLLNPGGPGGAGLPTAWGLRPSLPSAMLRGFDLVAWDVRGVGQSSPRIDCDDAVTPGDVGFIGRCAEVTGPLSAFLSAPYTAADMEAIRVALGEPRLDYLGFSYGSVLGATYAAAHPDTVGAFVLDGVTDPQAGSPQGPFTDGFPTLADDGFENALARFVEICDATDRCLPGLDSARVIDDLRAQVSVLPTPDLAGPPDRVTGDDLERLLDDALQNADDWELFATGLGDAERGDASTLAAILARFESRLSDDGGDSDDEGDPSGDDSNDEGSDGGPSGESDFAEANFLIYCADFGPLITQWAFCDGLPVNRRAAAAVEAVDVEQPILVIGTTFDPLTPGYHAPEFAEALVDATHIIWDGVGHTAFPSWTTCVDDVVDAQFLRLPLPEDGFSCDFLFGVADDRSLGDVLFGHGDLESARLLERSFLRRGAGSEDAACLADVVNQEQDRVISHVALDVTSDAAGRALDAARTAC